MGDCKIAAGNDYNGNTAVGNHKFKDDDYASSGKLVKCIHNTLYEEKATLEKELDKLDAEIRECANRLGEYLAKNLGTKESFEKELEITKKETNKEKEKWNNRIAEIDGQLSILKTKSTRRRLVALPPSYESPTSETHLPSSGPSAVSLGLVATAGLCAAFVIKRFYNRFTAKRRDSFGFLPDSRRPSLNAAERMV